MESRNLAYWRSSESYPKRRNCPYCQKFGNVNSIHDMNATCEFRVPGRGGNVNGVAKLGRKIAFFYEDFHAAIRARRAFEAIVQTFGMESGVEVGAWSFNMLGDPNFNAGILMDACRADVIVVSACGRRSVPPRIAAWLKICIAKAGRQSLLLVALPDDESPQLSASLETLARESGVEFAKCPSDSPSEAALMEGRSEEMPFSVERIHEPVFSLNSSPSRWSGLHD